MRNVPCDNRLALFCQRRRRHNCIFEIVHIAVSRRPKLLCTAPRNLENGKNPVNGLVRKGLPPTLAHNVVNRRKCMRGDKTDNLTLCAQGADSGRRSHPFSPFFENVENDVQINHDTPFHA